jgi:hypothetical protein
MPDALHVFQINDGDTVIAKSASDAWDILTETSGTTPDDMPGEEWVQLDDAAPLRIGCEDPPTEHGFPSAEGWAKPEGRSIWVSERTCAEWVALCGRGVLGGHD